MKIDQKLELLQQIRKVEAPHYLYNRIEGKIRNTGIAKLSSGNVWALGMGILVLLLINIAIVSSNLHMMKSQTGVAQSYGLSSSNSFYHD